MEMEDLLLPINSKIRFQGLVPIDCKSMTIRLLKAKARDMMEGEEEEAGAGRKEEQEHIFSEIVKVS